MHDRIPAIGTGRSDAHPVWRTGVFAVALAYILAYVLAYVLASILASGVAAAQSAERSGKQVVDAVCAECHGTGESGAPVIGDEQAWAPLAERGLSGLTESALNGIREMPAHGGDLSLTDVEIQRAITNMVNRSGGDWVEPMAGSALATERSGKQVVEMQCAQCHESGAGGAPRIGDREAWIPRLKNARGFDLLVRSAIHGHGPMPARGGMADLTDAEIREAVLYMYAPERATAEAAPATFPATPGQHHRVSDGIEFFLGITPAERIRGRFPADSTERTMHGGVPEGEGYYHLNLSLFESDSGEPITNAEVRAHVTGMGGASDKVLEGMSLYGTYSFGEYFRMPGRDTYTITLRIRRPGTQQPVTESFRYTPE